MLYSYLIYTKCVTEGANSNETAKKSVSECLETTSIVNQLTEQGDLAIIGRIDVNAPHTSMCTYIYSTYTHTYSLCIYLLRCTAEPS